MTITRLKHQPLIPTPDAGNEDAPASEVGRSDRALGLARSAASSFVRRVPRAVDATKVGASNTTSSLQTLPDSTLRWLAASAIGFGAGLYLRRAPRVLVAAGVAPAVLMGAAMVLRPIKPVPLEAEDGHRTAA